MKPLSANEKRQREREREREREGETKRERETEDRERQKTERDSNHMPGPWSEWLQEELTASTSKPWARLKDLPKGKPLEFKPELMKDFFWQRPM